MMKATLRWYKKNQKTTDAPSYAWTLERKTKAATEKAAQETIDRTIRAAQQEADHGDDTRLSNLAGATITVEITDARNQKVGGWTYKPTVRRKP